MLESTWRIEPMVVSKIWLSPVSLHPYPVNRVNTRLATPPLNMLLIGVVVGSIARKPFFMSLGCISLILVVTLDW